MKLAPATQSLVLLLNQSWSLVVALQHTETILLSLQQADRQNMELYQLLYRQNRLLSRRLSMLREGWEKLPADALKRLQTELVTQNQQAQTHCQVVGWLSQGDDCNGGPRFDVPQPPQDSGAAVPALGFD
jgi:hypothetical protein